MGDVCLRATHKEARLEIAVALTTELVREAQRVHALAATSAVALGRLLTGATLLAVSGKKEGSTSVQILSRSRIGSLYADCTHEGAARGMTKAPHLAFPLTATERESARRTLAAAIYPGQISLIRRLSSGEYAQSATSLVSGEIDLDLESYLNQSDQIPTLLVCDVVLEPTKAAGLFIQAMPDGDRELLEEYGRRWRDGGLARALIDAESAEQILALVAPEAEQVETPIPLRYSCRCSRERVLSSLKLFSVTDLAEMISEAKNVDVGCDLCGRKYQVEPDDLRRAFEELIKAEG